MARHTSNRHNKKNSVTILLPVRQENNSRYQLLDYWMSVMVGLLSVGLLLQRFRGVMSANAASVSSQAVTLSHDNRQPSFEIQFLGLAPLLLSSAVTYQSGNSALGFLASLPFWFARPVAAQSPGVNIVVPEFRLNSNVTGFQQSPSVASTSAGVWVVVWTGTQTGNGDIYAQRYASNGSVLGSEFRLNSNTTGSQSSSAVASLSAGVWVVVWTGTQTGNFDIYAQRYTLSGNVLGPEFRVNSNVTGNQYSPAVASQSSGEWVMVWSGEQTGNGDIYAQRYAANGSVVGSEFRMNSNVTGNQQSPAVASLSTGEWVVVWEGNQSGDYDIYARRYASNGNVLGSEFRVNSNATGNQASPELASLSSGDWVVVWRGVQTGDYDIYAQRYASNGSALGSEFRVNSATVGHQSDPKVISLSTGEWVVVWGGDQTGANDIYAQRYAMNGIVLGSEFRVNSATTGDQYNPAVASLSSGEWVGVWQGSQTGNSDIYGSIFSSTGPLSTTGSPTPSSITTSILSTTVKSTVTTQVSSTSRMPQSVTTNDNSVKTPAITSSLNAFTSSSSSGVSGTVTSANINQTPTTFITQQQAMTTNANSGVSSAVIGAAAGGVGLAACLGAIGFYAYRKKSRSKQLNHSAVNEAAGTSLKPTEHAMSRRPSDYVQMNVKQGNQSDNMIPVSNSRYGRIDEMKKLEKEYDTAPSF